MNENVKKPLPTSSLFSLFTMTTPVAPASPVTLAPPVTPALPITPNPVMVSSYNPKPLYHSSREASHTSSNARSTKRDAMLSSLPAKNFKIFYAQKTRQRETLWTNVGCTDTPAQSTKLTTLVKRKEAFGFVTRSIVKRRSNNDGHTQVLPNIWKNAMPESKDQRYCAHRTTERKIQNLT